MDRNTATTIGLETPLNEIVEKNPSLIPTLAGLGLDTCCSGALMLGDAAERHGLDPDQVLRMLGNTAAPAPACSIAPPACSIPLPPTG